MDTKALTELLFTKAQEMIQNSRMNEDNEIDETNTYQPALTANRATLADVMRAGHLPGSAILGADNIQELHRLAAEGKSCIVFCEHVSNMDVPSMYIRFLDHSPAFAEIFDKFIFIAGFKLNANPLVKLFAEMFARVVIYPIRSIAGLQENEEGKREQEKAKKINYSATKAIMELKKKGHIFVLYPAGTRYRPWEPESGRGMKETMAYLSIFDHFCCCSINGNNMIPQEHEDMTKEHYDPDVLVFNFGPVTGTKPFIAEINAANPGIDKEDVRQAQADEIMRRIGELHSSAEEYRKAHIG
jgi:glycerol-3-phosphate O-acyltransferase